MTGQGWHNCLSSTAECGIEGVVTGIPSLEPDMWITSTGSVVLEDQNESIETTSDVLPCQSAAEVVFAHKTGLTFTFGSNVGIVSNRPGFATRHYIISIIGNLGSR